METTKIKKLPLEEKVVLMKETIRKNFIKSGKIDQNLFLFSGNKVFGLEFKNTKIITKESYSNILKDIISEKINVVEKTYSCNIDNILIFYFLPFDLDLEDKNKVNLSNNQKNSEDLDYHFIVYQEDIFDIKLEVFDTITVKEGPIVHTVMSNTPTKFLNYSKLDVDDKIKGTLTNLI